MKQKGFTLIELLVVVAIIGILAAVGVVAYSGYTSGAKKKTTITNHKLIVKYIQNEWAKCEIGETSIIDGKFSLWESNTIVRYFCEKWGTASWFPKTIEDRAHASQWMDWYLTTLHLHMTVIFWQLIRTPIEVQDKSAIENARLEAIKLWGILDQHLEKKPFVINTSFCKVASFILVLIYLLNIIIN